MPQNQNLTEAQTGTPVIVEPWDPFRYCAPDPAMPAERALHWYKIFAHVLLLNCSERTRCVAVRAAEREAGSA
jgi:hypothetical protein